ncbi:MAG: hypothetical protein AAF937_11730 [Planctomycetota bacterium]
MRGKYDSRLRHTAARLRRVPMNAMLRDKVTWEPMREPHTGYTPVIGCMASIPEVALANVRLISRMDLTNAKEVILVFDRPPALMPEGFAEQLEAVRGGVPIRLLHYTERQHAAADRIRWGWVYAWMSWTTGIAHATTRHVILHDLDAMPINPAFFEERYKTAVELDATFFGIRWYHGNGFRDSDRLTTTFEMVMDASRVRAESEPHEAFNRIDTLGGRSVEYDTFLYTQHRLGNAAESPISQDDVVHPSQMICQYTDLLTGRNTHAMPDTTLPLMPAFMSIGGRDDLLAAITRHLESGGDHRLPFFGAHLDVSAVTRVHLDWLEDQARRLERAATGTVRPEVDRYLTLLRERVVLG